MIRANFSLRLGKFRAAFTADRFFAVIGSRWFKFVLAAAYLLIAWRAAQYPSLWTFIAGFTLCDALAQKGRELDQKVIDGQDVVIKKQAALLDMWTTSTERMVVDAIDKIRGPLRQEKSN